MIHFYKKSFPTTLLSTCNNIGDELRRSKKISKFKNRLRSLKRPPKKDAYGIHNPIGIKLYLDWG